MKPSFLFCLLLFGLHASGLTAQSRYTILNDTLTLDMTIEEPGYEFDGDLDEYDEDDVVFWKYEKPWGVIKFRANSAAEVCNALKKYKTSALAAQGGLTLYMVEGEIIGSGHDISWDAIKSL